MTYAKPLFACAACAATILMLATTAAPALGQPVTVTGQRPNPDAPTKIVKYGDLNIASAAGEKALIRRVGTAVNGVCYFGGGLSELHVERDCREFAWSGARPQITSALERARLNPNLAAASMSITISVR